MPAQSEVGAAIVDADLRVHLQHGVVLFVVFGSQLTIAAARNNTDRGVHARFCLRGTGGSGGRLVRQKERGIRRVPREMAPRSVAPSRMLSAIGVQTGRSVIRILCPCARSPAANRHIRCFGIIRHERGRRRFMRQSALSKPSLITWPAERAGLKGGRMPACLASTGTFGKVYDLAAKINELPAYLAAERRFVFNWVLHPGG